MDLRILKMKEEMEQHLKEKIIPFWEGLKDEENGGFYGYMDFDSLEVDKKYVKGCILHSRILWFFSNAYMVLGDEKLLEYADHAYEFLTKYCFDEKNGGIFWSVNYDGSVNEDLKHTYNQAFCIYALSSYYDASKKEEALKKAYEIFDIVESKCKDEGGYLEALTREFEICDNEKLSENGVMADRTMNTLLHVMEAYSELYRVDGNTDVEKSLKWIYDCFKDNMYNPKLHRQEVFFDNNYNSLIDLHSYGHDIETSWLAEVGIRVLDDKEYCDNILPVTADLADNILKVAFDGHSLNCECERGVDNTTKVWWVQAETVLGFFNAYENTGREDFLEASFAVWDYIKDVIVDKREGSEWLSEVDKDGVPSTKKPIVEPWKCPYHNGRMCLEIIKRVRKMEK